jgi:hypothetical protein
LTLYYSQLVSNDAFSNQICKLCASDLQSFSDLRKDLIQKQTSLYDLAGFELKSIQDIETEETSESYEMYYETAGDYESEVLEEIVDDTELVTEIDNFDEQSSSVLKIEKVSFKSDKDESDYYIDDDNKTMSDSSLSMLKNDVKEEEIECEVCGICVLHSHTEEHIELMHTAHEIYCDSCSKSFLSKIALRKHINEVHTVDTEKRARKRKLHYCSLCTKEYDYKKQLVDHIRSFHKKERNTQCDICLRRFYHRDIKKHIDHVHGEKKLECKFCGKMYSCYDNLKLHMRYHSVPQHVCHVQGCGKRFHQKSLLEHHQLKHGDKKQFDCSECGSSFFSTRDLKRHIQRVHEKVSRKCFGCDLNFCRKDKYREHVLKQHKELTDDERIAVLSDIKMLNWYETC